jgi:hypothetical protein
MSSTIAREISAKIIADLAQQGTVLSPSLVTRMPALVQTLIVLSKPLRTAMLSYFESAEAYLNIQRAGILIWSSNADVLSNTLRVVFAAANKLLEPLDSFMQAFPLDTIAKEVPEITDLLDTIKKNVPIKIPATVAVTISGLGGLDFFDGIESYSDLRDKIDDLEFRLIRATAFSTYMSGTLASVDAEIEKVTIYKTILNYLDI